MVQNSDDQICFAINVAHLIYPNAKDFKVHERSSEIRNETGLSIHAPVTFSDIPRLECALECKIVILWSWRFKNSSVQTLFQKHAYNIFMFLFKDHYYGIKKSQSLSHGYARVQVFPIQVMRTLVAVTKICIDVERVQNVGCFVTSFDCNSLLWKFTVKTPERG